MIRFAAEKIDEWLRSKNRKPMVLRGARQVGKTWLVRDAAKRHGLTLLELNFERFPNLADLFTENKPEEIISNISAELGINIVPESSLLFLDEIQAAPELLAKLRWFREDLPQLPVIAAGSLLEFAFRKFQYSMPVGRITYFHLEQLSFLEFVLASGNDQLYKKLINFKVEQKIPLSLHEKCLSLYRHYCLIGGMPEVVNDWITNNNFKSCLKIQQDLLETYRDDFNKYGKGIDARMLAGIMMSVAEQLGNKFIFRQVDPEANTSKIKNALNLLSTARVCSKIIHTSGNGLPLGAESNEKFFKVLMVDIGLISAQLGLASMKPRELKELIFSNKGGLAEQFVGQQLKAAQAPETAPLLYYWQRTGGRQGEIDYIIPYGSCIIPVEVKSGSAGSMKSLHQFMADKKLNFAVRCNLNLPVLEDLKVKTTLGTKVAYRLLSIPVYLAERLDELIAQVS